jgi:succinylglutamate desuccinylase
MAYKAMACGRRFIEKTINRMFKKTPKDTQLIESF